MREQPFDFIHAQDYQQDNHPNWRASCEGSSRGFFRRHGLRDGVERIGFELKPNRSTLGGAQDTASSAASSHSVGSDAATGSAVEGVSVASSPSSTTDVSGASDGIRP